MNQIGRYQIISYLGGGGMADVYRAHDPQFGREVAIKVIKANFLHDLKLRRRFEREAQIMASLTHPAIVPVHEFGEQNGQPYLVMALMTGGSLADRLQRRGVSVEEVVWILERLAPALDMAHARGIVHRDLKPANILFDQQGNPYIADFGIAKLLAQTTQGLSQTGMPIGTPAYMSPEQARGEKNIDGRSDIYSLGIILFEIMSGRLPYDANNRLGLIYQHVHKPIPDICAIKPDLPAGYQAVIERAMAKKREERYQTAGQMVSGLKAVAESRKRRRVPPRPRRAPWWQRWQQWPILVGAVTSLIISIIVVTLAMTEVSEQGFVATEPTTINTPTNTSLPPISTNTITETLVSPTATLAPTDTLVLPTSTRRPTYTLVPVTPPPDAVAYVERGDDYYERGDYEQAIAEYNEAIGINPDYAYAYNYRGLAYYNQANDEQAIADYNEAIRLDPNYATAYNNRGIAYSDQGNYEQAIADYNEAIRIDPDYAYAYNNRGLAYYNQANDEQAIADYNEAIRIDPDFAWAHDNRGHAYYNQGNYDQAIADFTRAIELNNDPLHDVYTARGIVYAEQGSYEQAIADYNEAIRLEPNYAMAYYSRGYAYEQLGNREQAIADYRKAVELGNDPEATQLAQENLRRLGAE